MTDAEFLLNLWSGPFGWIAAALWGAAWGSFFNVVICRVPAGESVVRPPSHCRACKTPIAWYDNIPLLSFLLLRGRCRNCGDTFSWRYFLTELLICLLAVLMHYLFVVKGTGPVGLRLAQLTITSLFSGLLVAIAAIDLDTPRIPNVITYPGIPVFALLSLLMGHPRWYDGLIGAVAGYLVIRLLADGYELLTGRLGMGYGDAKLLAIIGGLLGWQALLPTLFLASFQGSLIGITALVIARRGAPPEDEAEHEAEEPAKPKEDPEGEEDEEDEDEEYALSREANRASLRHARIPFGPFISLAALEILVCQDYLSVLFPYLY